MIKTEIIEALVPLKDPALIAMLAHFAEIHHYKKGEHIYDVGDMQKKIYILWSGILRCYFIDELQTDITDCFMTEKGLMKSDAAIAAVSASALAIGVSVTSLTTGMTTDVNSYMFGSILAMSKNDVAMSIILSIIVISIFIIFYNRLFLITSDEDFAKAIGINITFYQFLISFLTAITIVIGMRMMGTLLISSLIIFPAFIAKKFVRSFKYLVILSAFFSIFCFIFGILISFLFNLPTGAGIVLVNVVTLIFSSVINAIFGRLNLGSK